MRADAFLRALLLFSVVLTLCCSGGGNPWFSSDAGADGRVVEITDPSDTTLPPETMNPADVLDAIPEIVPEVVSDIADLLAEDEVEGPTPATWTHIHSASFGGPSSDKGLALTASAAGGVVFAGSFRSDAVTFGGLTLTNSHPDSNASDIFITGFDANGAIVSAWAYGGDYDDSVHGVEALADGEVILVGSFTSETLDLGAGPMENQGDMDGFVARIGADGAAIWSLGFGGPYMDVGFGASTTGSGAVYLTGDFFGPFVDLGDGPMAHSGNHGVPDGFVVRLDPDGAYEWSALFGGHGAEVPRAVAATPDGGVVVVGSYASPTFTAGEETWENQGLEDIFIIRYSPGGEVAWGMAFGGEAHDAPHDVVIGPDGAVIVIGSYQSLQIDPGGAPIPHQGQPGYHDLFILKISSDGVPLWAHGYGGTLWDLAKSVAVTADGAIHLTGAFQSPILDLMVPLPGPDDTTINPCELFAASFTADGVPYASQAFGGAAADFSYATATPTGGGLVVAGFTNSGPVGTPAADLLDLGGGPLPGHGHFDAFIGWFDPGP